MLERLSTQLPKGCLVHRTFRTHSKQPIRSFEASAQEFLPLLVSHRRNTSIPAALTVLIPQTNYCIDVKPSHGLRREETQLAPAFPRRWTSNCLPMHSLLLVARH